MDDERAKVIQAQIHLTLEDLKIIKEPDERRELLRRLHGLIDNLEKVFSHR